MHTDEWIAKESREDIKKTHGFSLKQEEYPLPMIKLHFGEEYVPIPQNRMIDFMVAGMENVYPLKSAVYGAWCYIAGEEMGLAREDIRCTLAGGRVPDWTGDEVEKAVFKWIEKKIQNEGPYVVLARAIESGYDYWYDGWYKDVDEPYQGEIGEEQEWEKDSQKGRK